MSSQSRYADVTTGTQPDQQIERIGLTIFTAGFFAGVLNVVGASIAATAPVSVTPIDVLEIGSPVACGLVFIGLAIHEYNAHQ